jgi:hypothetical protein
VARQVASPSSRPQGQPMVRRRRLWPVTLRRRGRRAAARTPPTRAASSQLTRLRPGRSLTALAMGRTLRPHNRRPGYAAQAHRPETVGRDSSGPINVAPIEANAIWTLSVAARAAPAQAPWKAAQVHPSTRHLLQQPRNQQAKIPDDNTRPSCCIERH